MKSYFAKLAARATLANVPASSPATTANLQDPFDDTATVASTSSPRNVVPERRTADRHVETSSVQGPPMKESNASQVETVASNLRFEATTRPPSAAVQEQTVENLGSRVLADQASTSQPDRPETRSEVSSRVETSEQIFTPVIVPRDPQSAASAEKQETRTKSESDIDARSAEDEREESVLLQKADAFMAALLERRPKEKARVDSEPESKESVPRHEVFTETMPTRLQPPPVEARPPESKDESPSVVIGKLTVEVMPPAPPPVAPARQVIVVRGDQNARSRAIGASQRFGLGQF